MSHFIHAPGPVACRPPSEPVVVVPGARICPRVPRLPVTSVDGRSPDRTGDVALEGVARVVPGAVAGNLASLAEGGNPADSGISSDEVRQAVAEAGTAYQKPEGGVPKTDLSEGVRMSLDLADAAVQPGDILTGDGDNRKIKSSLLPSYVDDVIEVANYASLPSPGEEGKIYVTLDTNKTYRWGGTAYVEISNPDLTEYAKRAELFPAWAKNTPYKTYSLAIHGNAIYKCTTAHTSGAEWDSTKWAAASGADVLRTIRDYAALSNKPSINGETVNGAKTAGDFGLLDQNNYAGYLSDYAIASTVADEFSYSKHYAVGDLCIRLGAGEQTYSVYRCTVAHHGTWNASHFERIPLAQALKDATTLTERGFSAWEWQGTPPTYEGKEVVLRLEDYPFAPDDTGKSWVAFTVDGEQCSVSGDPDARDDDNTLSTVTIYINDGYHTATRTALQGYQLGSQSDKPLASEAEAEALRTGVASLFLKLAPEWASGTTYRQYNLVQRDGVLYYKKSPGESSQTGAPGTDTTNWQSFSSLSDLTQLFLPLTGGTIDGDVGARVLQASYVRGSVCSSSENATLDNTLPFTATFGNDYIFLRRANNSQFLLSYPVLDSFPSHGDSQYIAWLAAVHNIAPAFSTSSTYDVGNLVSYVGKIYICHTAVTTPGDWTGSTNWTTTNATVEDALAALRTAIAGKADASDLEPLLFAQYYPDGSVKSAAEFTPGIKYNDPNTANRTITVKPFCITGSASDDNSSLVGRVVIPPFVDASGNGYIFDDGTRFKVVEIEGEYGGDEDNDSLTSIVVPTTVTEVGGNAIAGCASLVSVSLPAATSIGELAFSFCTSLTSISLPAATTIGDRAFDSCSSLASISLPAATSIGDSAFDSCSSLASISLPAATSIGDYAFSDCDSLASVDFGDTPRTSVPSLGEDAFYNVPNTCKIIVPYTQYDAWTAASGWSSLSQEFVRHAEKADKPATFTTGNLAALDANGNPTDSTIRAANVATKGNIPYDRITITTGQLQDHAEQKVTLNAATTTLTLPALTDLSGKVSDFGIDVVNGYEVSGTPTAASFSLAGTIGTDYNLIVPDGETWSEMSALAAGEMAIYYFTLSAFQIGDLPTWGVTKQVVTLVPVPTAP